MKKLKLNLDRQKNAYHVVNEKLVGDTAFVVIVRCAMAAHIGLVMTLRVLVAQAILAPPPTKLSAS